MEFQSFLNGKCGTIKKLAKKLSDYCLLHMERRSVDERLRDFSKIMGTNILVNTICDDDDDSWQVVYRIGLLEATVRGFDESICEQECKFQVLEKLTHFSIGSDDDTSLEIQNQADVLTVCVEEGKCAESSDSTRESETVDRHLQTAAELETVIDETATTVVVSPSPNENGKNDGRESSECRDKSATSVVQCTTDLSEQPKTPTENPETDATAETIVAKERVDTRGADDRSPDEQQPIVQSAETPDQTKTDPPVAWPEEAKRPMDYKKGSYDHFVESAMTLLDNLSDDSLSITTELMSILLVAANTTERAYFKLIVQMIMEKASQASDDETLLMATLCSEIVKNTSTDERPEVRNVIPDVFKRQLLDSCAAYLWDAAKQPRVCNLDEHLRVLQTCKFIGYLFMQNDSPLKLFCFVSHVVGKFVASPSANSLECLSVLLTVVGPRFKKVNKSKSKFSLKEVYRELEACRTRGCTPDGVVLPKRTVSMLEHLLGLRKNNWRQESAVQED